MFEFWLSLVFAWIAVVLPFGAARRVKAMGAALVGRSSRVLQLQLYPRLIFGQWILALAVVLTLWKLGIPPARLGIRLPALVPFAYVTGVIALAWILWGRRLQRALHEPARRAHLLERYARMRFLLPVDDDMVGWWVAVSCTAGICEETLYRGFVGFYLTQWMPLWAAALIGSLPFAAAHAYQGWRGVMRTGLLGLVLWATYVVTGSILPAMAIHAAIDVRSGLALKRAVALDAAVPA